MWIVLFREIIEGHRRRAFSPPFPLNASPQATKDEYAAGVAVRVNCVPGSKLPLQVCPHLIPDGLLATFSDMLVLAVSVGVLGPSIIKAHSRFGQGAYRIDCIAVAASAQ